MPRLLEGISVKVLVCGDRHWNDAKVMQSRLDELPEDTIIIEGEAPGADSMARDYAKSHGMEFMAFPADWDGLGRKAGPIRNRQMLDEKPDLVIAFHKKLSESKGTMDTVMEANRRGIKVEIISSS